MQGCCGSKSQGAGKRGNQYLGCLIMRSPWKHEAPTLMAPGPGACWLSRCSTILDPSYCLRVYGPYCYTKSGPNLDPTRAGKHKERNHLRRAYKSGTQPPFIVVRQLENFHLPAII